MLRSWKLPTDLKKLIDTVDKDVFKKSKYKAHKQGLDRN